MLALASIVVFLVGLSALGFHGRSTAADDSKSQKKTSPPSKEASVWMKQKLTSSQEILKGLTEADFDLIRKNAQAMLAVDYMEQWFRADTPDYRLLVSDFRFANETLVRAAREKNLERATVAYLGLTLSCVNCHNIVRDAGAPPK